MKKKGYLLFKIIRATIALFYGKIEIEGMENLPDNNAVIVGNHTQINGPIACELFMPDNCYTWCAGEMMKLKEVPKYAFDDFWSQKPKWTHPFFKLMSYIIAPFSVSVFNNARTVPVYKDIRIMSTFKSSVKMLNEGKNIIIFPEHDQKHNNIIYDFHRNFIDIAALYYKKTGIELNFVPMYIAPNLKKIYIGKPIKYCTTNLKENEMNRIAEYLMNEITEIARNLPLHIVVPYRNIPKKYYLTNKDTTEVPR